MISEKEYKAKISLQHRKKYAQFFTPEPVAKIMIDWILKTPNFQILLEPAFGLGVFSRLILEQKKDILIKAFDIDPVIFDIAKRNFNNISNIRYCLGDYLFNDWNHKYDAVICNPPYFKFHDYENKKTLEEFKSRLKIGLSGFTNIYTLFLLKSIYQLRKNGRSAYIVPSEFLNSNYGTLVKEYLLETKTLRHIIVFDFVENVFDDALTTSAILLLEKNDSVEKVAFSKINTIAELQKYPDIHKFQYNVTGLKPDIKWRKYYTKQSGIKYRHLIPFGSIAKVVRGIATGANDYFTFSRCKAAEFHIEEDYLLPCITKSKSAPFSFFTQKDFQELRDNNATVYLINACANDANEHIKNYIQIGEERGIHQKYLTSKRNPWYALEKRSPAPIWVSVFNRNGLRFVRNEAKISNLTTFHCVYPRTDLFTQINIDLLFAYLLTDVAKQIFNDNQREYGDGLKKFEPNDLNNAMMLDLSKLDSETENMIIHLYLYYRNTIIDKKPDEKYVNKINELFLQKYKI